MIISPHDYLMNRKLNRTVIVSNRVDLNILILFTVNFDQFNDKLNQIFHWLKL